jgi:diketogulonate reductase-like aldo/keto reductase
MTRSVGVSIPPIAYGTAKLGDETERFVREAIEAGYRHFDCAEYYGNEAGVGKAIALAISEGKVTREELFITSKVWTTSIANGAVTESLNHSLENLKVGYVDLYLLHWPVPGEQHIHAWKDLILLRNEGLTRSIGVSNYTIEDIDDIIRAGLEIPACNQIEVSPFLFRPVTLKYMQSLGMHVMSYRALSKGDATSLSHPALLRVAQKHGITAAQTVFAWCMHKGIGVIIASKDKQRMISNIENIDVSLDLVDIEAMNSLTTDSALQKFKDTYNACTIRDTHLTTPRAEFTLL